MTALAALPTTVELGTADGRPFTVDACVDAAGGAVTAVEAGERSSIGAVRPGAVVTCTVRRAVVDSDRTTGSSPVSLLAALSADGGAP